MASARTLLCLCGQRAEDCALSQVFVRAHLTARAFALYERRSLETLLRSTHDFRWCRHCAGGGFVPRKCMGECACLG